MCWEVAIKLLYMFLNDKTNYDITDRVKGPKDSHTIDLKLTKKVSHNKKTKVFRA